MYLSSEKKELEKGKYKFFDIETGWMERKKSDFTFKY